MSRPHHDTCLLCGCPDLIDFPVAPLVGVTSDGRPWDCVGVFCSCHACGHVQKRLSDHWRAQVAEIYRTYEMYTLSDGAEPLLFDGPATVPRTQRLLETLVRQFAFPSTGRLLDVGCGNGSFLRSFGKCFPGWELSGCDQQEDRRQAVMQVPGVRDFHCCQIEEVPGSFDMVTLMYVIEHLFSPVQALVAIREKLSEGGLLLVHTSDLRKNPFDLPVVDHCSHFTLEALEGAVVAAGFKILAASDSWNEKEIGVLAQCADVAPPKPGPYTQSRPAAAAHLQWLLDVRDQARAAAQGGHFGIFGTSNAAVWLAASLEEGVSFFLDDDATKHGKTCMGLPILDVADAPPSASVYMAFPPQMARRVAERAAKRRGDVRYIVPPELAELPADSPLR